MSEPTFEDELASAEQAYSLAESELSALRAEVETLRRALEWVLRKTVDSMDCPPEFRGAVSCDGPSISEARKGERRERW